jgi:hypothetical protein
MIKDYQNKEILAAMKHQLNAAAKKSLMGDKLAKDIVTAADDKAAAEVFYWGLIGGEQGVANGSMPTGMADMDIRHKPKRNKGIPN